MSKTATFITVIFGVVPKPASDPNMALISNFKPAHIFVDVHFADVTRILNEPEKIVANLVFCGPEHMFMNVHFV